MINLQRLETAITTTLLHFYTAQNQQILANMHPHLHTKDNTGMRQDSHTFAPLLTAVPTQLARTS